jgi:hypothetical protein
MIEPTPQYSTPTLVFPGMLYVYREPVNNDNASFQNGVPLEG